MRAPPDYLVRYGAWLLAAAAALASCSGDDHAASPISSGTSGSGARSHAGDANSPHGGAGAAGESPTGGSAQQIGGETGAAAKGGQGPVGGESPVGGTPAEGGTPAAGGAPTQASSEPPSCRADKKPPICGPNVDSCCLSLPIPGQAFYRSYDAVSPMYSSQTSPAAVSQFRLDRFEVTIGRFRKFVAAAVDAWRPDAGSGKHAHLHDKQGLANVGPDGGYESGWDAAWNDQLPTDKAAWDAALTCDNVTPTWSPEPGDGELLPVNCVTWYEAYAFCIWDDGFLPSEAEWNDVATGGDQQRAYPWSLVPTSLDIDCLHANYAPGGEFCSATNIGTVTLVGAESPKGDSRWGHADMGGNVYEWALDWYADSYKTPCADCTYVDTTTLHAIRGGGFGNDAAALLASARGSNQATARSTSLGVRCARVPVFP